ncbi:MAG: ATP-binding protein [Alphaproteobacteria bacterium]
MTIASQDDLIQARKVARELAQAVGFTAVDQTRLAAAVAEIGRNALLYAGSGACEFVGRRRGRSASVAVVVTDQGPGIADVDAALTPGFATGLGLGGGIAGTRRLVDDFAIDSRPGHTAVSFRMARDV